MPFIFVVKKFLKNKNGEMFGGENLQKYFAYCTTENLDKMASWILSRYKSASVIFNDSKKRN